MNSSIFAIVLAAGESSRMGSPKMLLDFNGRSMLETVINNIKESGIDNIIVVLGAHFHELADIVERTSATICLNDNYKEGMLSSVRCGIKNLPSEADAVLIFQGDQPLITSKVINRVTEAYLDSGAGIVIPVCGKRRGHPLLIGRKYFNEIYNLDPAKGLRSLAYIHSGDVLEIETGDNDILKDIDTYEDYRNQINQKQQIWKR